MPIEPEIVTFDCYGTLIDWEEGIGAAFETAAGKDGVALDREDVLSAYAEIEPTVETGPYRSYREVLRETARRVARRFRWDLTEEQAEFLPQSLGRWPPFADTRPALGRLIDSGYRLGLLSNVDLDLLSSTLRVLGIEFELIVTAEDVSAYKPNPAHFLEARRRIGGSTWLHAAQSYFHDVVPATQLGIPTAWINRRGATPGGAGLPDHEFRTLGELADRLAPDA